MRKYGKWVLTLSLLAATPGLTFAAGSTSKDSKPSAGARASRIDNQQVAESIKAALSGKVRGDIGIEFKDGVAILGGSVTDPKMKQRASELAAKVSGVAKVDNRIAVAEKKQTNSERLAGVATGASGGVMQAAHAGEGSRRSQVQQVNAEAPDVTPAAPVVAYAPVANGPVASAPGNQEIAEQIGAALSAAQLDGYDIQIRFQGGVATLDGSVGTQAERSTASRVVSSVSGVRNVANRLRSMEEPAAQFASAAPQRGYGPPQGDVRSARYAPPAQGQYPAQQMSAQGYPGAQGGYQGAQGGPAGGGMPMGPGAPPYPPSYGNPGAGASQAVYNSPNLPDNSWPTYAQYPNSAAVSYPQQYSASAWPYIGPFYPYPQVPLGWRDATLRWDDGQWNLMFKPRTDRWWWFMNPNNW